MIMILTLLAFISICHTGCIITPGSFREISRMYAPDSSKYLLSYQLEQGAWDGGRTWLITVSEASDAHTSLLGKKAIRSSDIENIYWKGSDTVVIHENFAGYISRGASAFNDSLFEINGAIIQALQHDPIDSAYTKKILYRETSPGGRYELVVYRHVKPGEGYYFLNVSVVPTGGSIPKYGNFFIAQDNHDVINHIRWRGGDTLNIGVSSMYSSIFTGLLVKNRPAIPFEIRAYDAPGFRQ